LLTFWPPGPDERVARHDHASGGTKTAGETTIAWRIAKSFGAR
jgi:hypothetical protein